MKRSPAFAAALARARARAGYRSPWAFHRARGRLLGLAFVNYLPLERGTSLPRPARLPRLLSALGLRPGTPDAAALVRAYARALLGSDELYACLDAAPAGPDPVPPRRAAVEAFSRGARARRTAQLTLEQYRVLAGDADAYACNAVLVNTEPWLTARELAQETGLSPERARRAVGLLARAGLAETGAGGARSPFWDRYLSGAPRSAAFAAVQAKFDAHRARWAAARGRAAHKTYLLVRAREKDFRRYFAHLDEAVSMSALYGDLKRGPGSALWLVEGAVTRL